MLKILLSILTTFVLISPSIARNLTVEAIPIKESGYVPTRTEQKLDTVLATSDNVVVNDANQLLSSRIKTKNSVGVVNLPLVSKVDTKVKVQFEDPNLAIRVVREYHTLRAGRPYTLQFAAFQATSGTLKVLNENNEVILTVPYQVLNRKKLKQGVGVGINHSIRESKTSTRMNANYRVSTHKTDDTDGSHSVNFRVSTDDEFIDKQFSIQYNYNW